MRKRVIVPGAKQTVASVAKARLPQVTVARANVQGAEGAVDLRQHMAEKADPAVRLAEQVGRQISPAEAELARHYAKARGGQLPNRKARRKAITKRKRFERPAFKGIRR